MSTGQIHDLGYKRYVGTRRSLGTRWTVIMRHQIASAWKGWWRFKVWLICAVMVTVVTSVLLYTLQGNVFRRLGGFGAVTRFIDGILPDSTQWFCKVGFIVSLTISSMVVGTTVVNATADIPVVGPSNGPVITITRTICFARPSIGNMLIR